MNKILQNTRYRAVLFFAAIMLVANSCEVDDPFGPNEAVAELEGDWSCDESSGIFKSTNTVYTVTITADPDNENGVIIDNFYAVGISVRANVSGQMLTIPNQNAEDGYSVYGSGSISGNAQTINMGYVVNDGSGGPVDNATAIYSKIN